MILSGVVLFEHKACIVGAFYAIVFAVVDCIFAFAAGLHPDFFDLFWHVFQDMFGDFWRDYEDYGVYFRVAGFESFVGFYALYFLFPGVYRYYFVAGFFQVLCDFIAVFFGVV